MKAATKAVAGVSAGLVGLTAAAVPASAAPASAAPATAAPVEAVSGAAVLAARVPVAEHLHVVQAVTPRLQTGGNTGGGQGGGCKAASG